LGLSDQFAETLADAARLQLEAFAIMEAARRAPGHAPATEALEFVRFCYRRRRIGWPELYDEMCAVAGRGLYQGWGAEELAAVGIGLSLFEMPALAALAARVIVEESTAARAGEPHRRGATRAGLAVTGLDPEAAAPGEPGSVDRRGPMRLVPGAI
jgi:hypothetical protein